MPRIEFDLFSVVTPVGWEDITDSFEADQPPATLARTDGVGALQFSIARYSRGPVPDPSPNELLEMLREFAETQGLNAPHDVEVDSEPLRLAAASFVWGEHFLRVWQGSDGHSFVRATYTCDFGQQTQELEDCEQIIRSLKFKATAENA